MISENKLKELQTKNIAVNTTEFILSSDAPLVTIDTIKYLTLLPCLSPVLIQRFRDHESQLYPVGIQGLSDVTNKDQIGSFRKTIYDPSLAEFLSKLILPHFHSHVLTNIYSPVQTDTEEETKWKVNCISPLFRYMEYNKGGEHYAHYDAPYVTDEKTRTLFSGVLYLTTNNCGTRILQDHQQDIPFSKRNIQDHTKTLKKGTPVWAYFPSLADRVSIFPHGVCHDVSENTENTKRIIIRFDIECTKV